MSPPEPSLVTLLHSQTVALRACCDAVLMTLSQLAGKPAQAPPDPRAPGKVFGKAQETEEPEPDVTDLARRIKRTTRRLARSDKHR